MSCGYIKASWRTVSARARSAVLVGVLAASLINDTKAAVDPVRMIFQGEDCDETGFLIQQRMRDCVMKAAEK